MGAYMSQTIATSTSPTSLSAAWGSISTLPKQRNGSRVAATMTTSRSASPGSPVVMSGYTAPTDHIAPPIAIAGERGRPLAIRGGGHNVAGNGTVDDGIVLDLGRLDTVEVDPAARLVRVGAGARLRDIDRATEPYALAVPIGVV